MGEKNESGLKDVVVSPNDEDTNAAFDMIAKAHLVGGEVAAVACAVSMQIAVMSALSQIMGDTQASEILAEGYNCYFSERRDGREYTH